MAMGKDNQAVFKEVSPAYQVGMPDGGANNSSMLDDSLAMSPWERILANDDIVNFGDSLSLAMEKRNAKPR